MQKPIFAIAVLFAILNLGPDGLRTTALGHESTIFEEMQQVSDWDFIGGMDAVMQGIPLVLTDEGWVESAKVDRVALGRCGTRLENISLQPCKTSGLTRLSAVRSLCAAHGIGFFGTGNRQIAISTQSISDQAWRDSFQPPDREMLVSTNVLIRRRAVFLAAYFPAHDVVDCELLTSLLRDPDLDVRCNAAFAIPALGAVTAKTIEELATGAQSENSTMRWACCFALGRLGQKGENALLAVIEHGELPAAKNAADAFCNRGLSAARCQAKLIQGAVSRFTSNKLNDQEREYLKTVADALSQIDDGELDSLAIELTSGTSPVGRMLGLMAIASQGPRCELDMDRLAPMLESTDPIEQKWAVFAVWMTRNNTLSSMAAIEKALLADDPNTKSWARHILQESRSKEHRN